MNGFITLEMDQQVRLNQAVRNAKEQGIAEGLSLGKEQGIAEGMTEGSARFARLTSLLLDADRLDDLKRATEDEAFREVLYREFAI